MNTATNPPPLPENGWLYTLQPLLAFLPVGIPFPIFPILQAIHGLANSRTSGLVYAAFVLSLIWKLRHQFIYTVVVRDSSRQKILNALANKTWTSRLRLTSVEIGTPTAPDTTPSLKILPTHGSKAVLWHRRVPLQINFNAGDENKDRLDITISSLFSPGPIHRFLKDYAAMEPQLYLYMLNDARAEKGYSHPWDLRKSPLRKPESLATTPGQKDIRKITAEFFTREAYYKEKQVPYRKGFLFHGPPGTGKSAMATALASEYSLPIYVLSLSGLRDSQFLNIVSHIPRCVALFEDIDTAGIRRDDPAAPASPAALAAPALGLSLSGFLNGLDRIQQGSLIILTTNAPEKLDDAITRKGRVDHRIEFTFATKDQAAQLFRWLMLNPTDGDKEDKENLVKTFCSEIPEGALTTADLQDYLLRYEPGDAVGAAANVREWVQTLEGK